MENKILNNNLEIKIKDVRIDDVDSCLKLDKNNKLENVLSEQDIKEILKEGKYPEHKINIDSKK